MLNLQACSSQDSELMTVSADRLRTYCAGQAFPHRGLAATSSPSNTAAIESLASVESAADLMSPNTTISGKISTALLDDAAFVAAPVPVVPTAILNISATNASASVLV